MGKITRKNKRQICKEEFDEVSMQIHRATIHNIANKKHKCEICEKDFKTQNTLRYHFTTIHYNKGIHCNICASRVLNCNPAILANLVLNCNLAIFANLVLNCNPTIFANRVSNCNPTIYKVFQYVSWLKAAFVK